jgi:cytochrome c biogenesis protein ResB
VLAAAVLILVGLIPALFVTRRKIWILVEPDAGGSVVKLGGFALQHKDALEEEFARIRGSLEPSGREAGMRA